MKNKKKLSTKVLYPKMNINIAFIMDGNRRWAKKNRTDLITSYKNGITVFLDILLECIKYNLSIIVFYALSADNYNKRKKIEIDVIFNAAISTLKEQKNFFVKNQIQIICIGDKTLCNEETLKIILEVENDTNLYNSILKAYILLIYDPVKDVLNYGKNNTLLYSNSIPNLDLIIRTGGHNRLSGLLPIQSMYANIITIKDLWPDFKSNILYSILSKYKKNQNYGK
jgi:undecaprenyl diphosphate synthase